MWCVCKPNLVKDFCPRLPLDLDLDFVLGLGQAFQNENSLRGARSIVIHLYRRVPIVLFAGLGDEWYG